MHLQELTQSNRCSERMRSPTTWKGDGQDAGGGVWFAALRWSICNRRMRCDSSEPSGTTRAGLPAGISPAIAEQSSAATAPVARVLDGNTDQRWKRRGSPVSDAAVYRDEASQAQSMTIFRQYSGLIEPREKNEEKKRDGNKTNQDQGH